MKGFGKKIEKLVLFLIVVMIPTQLGKHFWPGWSLVSGVRIDYQSLTIYLVDVLWFFWIGLVIWRVRFGFLKKSELKFEYLLIGMFILVNILAAQNKGVAIYSWLRIFQWVWFYRYCRNNKTEVKTILKRVIPWWIMGESLLGWAQMTKGGSLNGLMWWLGERRFDISTMGVAQFSVLGRGLIRAYGTFSHPNSLAGFLLISLGLWMGFYKNSRKIYWWMITWFACLGIILSGSRTIWLLSLGLMGLIFIKIYKNKIGIKKTFGCLVIVLGLFLLVLGVVSVNYQTRDFLGGWDSESWTKRMSLNVAAVKMWQENLTLGVGAGNFISRLPEYQSNGQFYWLQPVHNIVLLAGSEIGVLGLIVVLWLFKDLVTKKSWGRKWWLLMIILASGMVDHYWLTLPQNTWLLAIVLGIF